MLENISLKGYKTFQSLDLELRPINILIGANGAGKSNFISLFKMLSRMMRREFQLYVAQGGGADHILHYGQKRTQQLSLSLWFKNAEGLFNGYLCDLVPADDTLIFKGESIFFHDRNKYLNPYLDRNHTNPSLESRLPDWATSYRKISLYVYKAMHSWQLYHFHDTSEGARVKQTGDIMDNAFLQPDAGNLAAYLHYLREKYPQHYRNIVEAIRLVAPFFGDFVLRPHPFNADKIRLEWREQGSDVIFGPQALSDGTLRFMCLATLFLQPKEKLPYIVIIDEPELGLHPFAIRLLSEMVQSIALNTQVIIATQSVTFINHFSPDDILVIDRKDGLSTITPLRNMDIEGWLEDYGLGDLWEKNVFGGRPE